MNIAQRSIEYFESEDFKGQYWDVLLEDSHDAIDRIKDIALHTYEFAEMYGKNIYIDNNTARAIYEHIVDNFSDFVREFHNAYVGYSSINSVNFGEQEIELRGVYNSKTGKEYTLLYMRKIHDKEGFFVSGDMAYFDLGYSGVHIDMLACEIPILKELTT